MGNRGAYFWSTLKMQKEHGTISYLIYWAKHLDGILTSTGENLLTGNGTVSHLQAVEKAQTEYRKYKAKTLSSVEKDYLESISC